MTENTTHELKTLPVYFQAARDGDKTFEIRNNFDRGFQKGDKVILREWNNKAYPGREIFAKITYVTNYMQRENYVVFGFAVTGEKTFIKGSNEN